MSQHPAATPPDGEAFLLPEPPAAEPVHVTCRLCGRPLTGRQARTRGMGDGCRAKLRERSAPRPPEREIDQETLPGL